MACSVHEIRAIKQTLHSYDEFTVHKLYLVVENTTPGCLSNCCTVYGSVDFTVRLESFKSCHTHAVVTMYSKSENLITLL